MTDTTPQADSPAPPVHDELWRHLDWSFWGTGMADEFREPLAEAMLAGITSEQRQQANDLITGWRDHREFVGRDKYEEQKAEIESLKAQLAERRDQVLTEAPEIAGKVIGPLWHLDTLHEITERLNAARTTTALEG